MGLPVLIGLAGLVLVGGAIEAFALAALVVSYAALTTIAVRTLGRLRRQAEAAQHLALHDPVTELPNRTLFHDRTHQAIAAARRDDAGVGVLLLDLDGFKEINDTLGHHSGDLLLHQVGERLASTIRSSDSVARLGGDEFALLLTEIEGQPGAQLAAERTRKALDAPFEVQGVALSVEASIGAALYPEHGGDPELLLQRADVAMYHCKRSHAGVEIYSIEGDTHSRERLSLIHELRKAIEDETLFLHFQPKAELGSSGIVGVEALLRWEHPQRGPLPPDEFIPIAESTGLIQPLTRFVLKAALAQSSAWRKQGLDLTMAVNLSTRNLLDPELPAAVAELLSRYEVPADRLELEVTETMMMVDPVRAAETLRRIADLGCTIAIDDFGTGYTSLSWLKRLPVTTLKIDRSFVMGMETDEDDTAIVRSTINLAGDLGLETVAEGVEGQKAWSELGSLGCDLAQGYLLSRPQSADLLTPWLEERLLPDTPARSNGRPTGHGPRATGHGPSVAAFS